MIEIGDCEFTLPQLKTKIRIHGLYISDPYEVPKDITTSDFTHRTDGIEFFAVSRTYENEIQKPTQEEFKEILEDHGIPPHMVVDVQTARVEESRSIG